MHKAHHIALEILRSDPDATLVYIDNPRNAPIVHVHTTDHDHQWTSQAAIRLSGLPVVVHAGPKIRDLRLFSPAPIALNAHQNCQDEPVQLGTQLQPLGASWVGTAGAPARWKGSDGKDRWGILSNWHVMVTPAAKIGHTQHQPFTDRPAVAALAAWSAVSASQPNTLDAAIADAYMNGKHTIAREIIGLGALGSKPIDAAVGLNAAKSGRTTAVTRARCSATGAAVRVGYGDFEATFADQDVYQDVAGSFSAAGDSGSAILGESCRCLASLLFAGGGNLTIGCPSRYAVRYFTLLFPVF